MNDRRLPHLTWLRAFEASARHLSFTHAAQELNLTQAAISKQVKLLEYYLREPLFERKPRSLALTKLGAAYLPKVRDSFDRLADGTQEVFGHLHSDVLTVRAPVIYAVNWLAPRLQEFRKLHPHIPIRLLSSVWGDPFNKEQFDLDIQYGNGFWPGFRADRLTWETITPVCAPALLSGNAPLKSPADLQTQTLLHVLGYQEGWATWLVEAGAQEVNPGQGLQFDNSLMAFEYAAHGGGVALARSSIFSAEAKRARLIKPFDLEIAINEAFYIISPEDNTHREDTEVFRAWLVKAAQENVDQPAN